MYLGEETILFAVNVLSYKYTFGIRAWSSTICIHRPKPRGLYDLVCQDFDVVYLRTFYNIEDLINDALNRQSSNLRSVLQALHTCYEAVRAMQQL